MIVGEEISKRLFIIGVLFISVVPRQHIDRRSCSIGGNLSAKFKELLVLLVFLNLIRLLASDEIRTSRSQMVSDTLGVVEVVGLSFLCFLSPYLLQTWLQDRINLGGRPGANLMGPLYLATGCSVFGVVLSRTVHPNLWCLKKIGNAISGPPVLKTLRLFNTVTTRGGHHDGRGTIMSQSLMVVEYWHLVAQLLCAFGYAMDPHKGTADFTQWDHFLAAFRSISFVSDWLRVCAHAMFINLLDELFLSSPTTNAEEGGEGTDDGAVEVVSLVRRSAANVPSST